MFGWFFMPSQGKEIRCMYVGNLMFFWFGVCRYEPNHDAYRCLWGYR